MLIDRAKFISILDKLELYSKADDVLEKHLDNFVEGTGFATIHSGKWSNAIVDMLEHLFDDDSEWIHYFIYCLNFGKKWDKTTASRADGSIIDISDASHLYTFLIEEQDIKVDENV